jgi:hypothetical protein
LDPALETNTSVVFVQKVKTQCCAAAQLLDVLETKYGKDDGTVQWAQYGLPGSKYVVPNY